MRAFNVAAVVFLVLLMAFVFMTLDRLKLQDTRLRYIEDRIHNLETEGDTTRL